MCEHFEMPFKNIVGSALSVQRVCVQLQQRWIQGQRNCFVCCVWNYCLLLL